MSNSLNVMRHSSLKNHVASAVFAKRDLVSSWFQKKFEQYPSAFYCSIDIRDSGEKIAPVDCNLFPAGFNNICEVDLEFAPSIFRSQIEKMATRLGCAVPAKILIIPENHTENKFYLENLHHLKSILEEAGFEIAFGRYGEDPNTYELKTASEKLIAEYPLQLDGKTVKLAHGFVPGWILLNNDFSAGYPSLLDGVTQPVVPSHKLGWHSRKKSTHFHYYNQVAAELAEVIHIDPWLIQIESEAVDHVNFGEDQGIDRVIEVADRMLKSIASKYALHGIQEKPALFIKNDSGTYGIGIMVIHSAEELRTMNRRTKNKMSMGKNKSQISQVLVQEGVPTTLTTDGSTSEPVIYMMGEELIGGFIRANSERDSMDNLNSQGMFFKKLCFKDLSDCLMNGNQEELPLLEAVYGIIGKLSALAAAMELKEIQKS